MADKVSLSFTLPLFSALTLYTFSDFLILTFLLSFVLILKPLFLLEVVTVTLMSSLSPVPMVISSPTVSSAFDFESTMLSALAPALMSALVSACVSSVLAVNIKLPARAPNISDFKILFVIVSPLFVIHISSILFLPRPFQSKPLSQYKVYPIICQKSNADFPHRLYSLAKFLYIP